MSAEFVEKMRYHAESWGIGKRIGRKNLLKNGQKEKDNSKKCFGCKSTASFGAFVD